MSTNTRPVNLVFGGLDERGESLILPQPKLTKVNNMYRRYNGSYVKRLGYQSLETTDSDGTTISEPRRVISHGNQLNLLNNKSLFTWTENLTEWKDTDRVPECVLTKREPLARNNAYDITSASMEVSFDGKVAVYAWLEATGASSTRRLYAQVIDLETNAVLLPPTLLIADNVQHPRVVRTTTKMAVFWHNATTDDIEAAIMTTASPFAGFGSAITVAAVSTTTPLMHFDVCSLIPNTFALAYIDTALDVVAAIVNDSLAITSSVTHSPSANVQAVSIDAGSHIHVAYYTGLPEVACRRYATDLSGGTSTTVDNTGGMFAWQLSVKEMANGTALVCWTMSSSTADMNKTKYALVSNGTTAGTVRTTLLGRLRSTPFVSSVGDRAFVLLQNIDGGVSNDLAQDVYIVCELAESFNSVWVSHREPKPHARVAAGAASTESAGTSYFRARPFRAAQYGLAVYLPLTVTIVASVGRITAKTTVLAGVDLFTFKTQESLNCSQAVVQGRRFLSGYVCEYDGLLVTETGFTNYPYVTQTNAAGSIIAGTYFYKVVWEWLDSQGNRHQSAPSEALQVVLGVNSTVTLTVRRAPSSRKADAQNETRKIVAAVYRTTVGGSIYYRLEGPNATVFSELSPNATTELTYVDDATDAGVDLSSREQLYTDRGELPNFPPPPSRILAGWSNRLFGVDDEYPYDIWFTKELETGVGAATNPILRMSLNDGGPNTALAAQDRLLVFKDSSIWAISGDGPARNGVGTFFPPQEITSGVGCIEPRSIATDAEGTVYFQSRRGIEALPRGGSSPVCISDPIYDSFFIQGAHQSIVGAAHLPEKSLIVFAANKTSSGKVFAWDYRAREWSIYTFGTTTSTATLVSVCSSVSLNNADIGKTALNRTDLVLIYTDQYIRHFSDSWTGSGTSENEFVDGAAFVEGQLETGDFRFDLAGRVSVPEVHIVGVYKDTCQLKIEASYDRGLSWPDSHTKTLSGLTAGSALQFRWQPKTPEPESGFIRYRLTILNNAQVDSEGVHLIGLRLDVQNLGTGPLLGSAMRG